MEEKAGVVANNELEKVTSRRSRKDEEGRDFQCGCGKRYLSYPALYTHIKTKHEGRQPEGTLKTGTNLITKRAKAKLEEETLRAINSLFRREQIRLFNELGEAAQGFISVSARIKKDLASKQLHQCYITLIKQKQLRLTPNSPLELALVVYLINMGGFINDKLYEQLLFFARNARTCFAEHAEEIYRGYYSRKDWEGGLYIQGFHAGEVRFFPMVADFFVQCYLPFVEQREGKKVSKSLFQLLAYDFCNWLHLRKLTKIRTELADDFKLDYTPDVAKPKATPSKIDVNHEQALGEVSNSKEHREEVEEEEDEGSENEEQEYEGEEEKKPSVGKDREMIGE